MSSDVSRRQALDGAMQALLATSALLDPLRLRIWDEQGLTVTQLRLLRFVSEEEGLSNADLADRLLVTRPSVSALLERLERGGFIRREISPTDRRGICISLQERGRNALASLREETYEYIEGLMESMDERDLAALAAAMEKLIASGRERRRRDLQAFRAPAG
ncbi:MAG: MarR family transcriptional regulator [Dehalococcoidia bacterium]|nr:MarR family transcriptional regulator [Dehalococcoidia bacterium]